MAEGDATTRFGEELRWRRERARYSQLGLAAAAEVSQRHLSFLETGRSRPSRQMVLDLAGALDLPLRDRNSLLRSAGFTPEFTERVFGDGPSDEVEWALRRMVAGHAPNPVRLVDRRGDVVLANVAGRRLGALAGIEVPSAIGRNLVRFYLDPGGVRPAVVGWERFAAALLRRLERIADRHPTDDGVTAVVTEARRLCPAPAESMDESDEGSVVPLVISGPAGELRFLVMVGEIAGPRDAGLQELWMETLLPMDEHTDAALRRAVGRDHGD